MDTGLSSWKTTIFFLIVVFFLKTAQKAVLSRKPTPLPLLLRIRMTNPIWVASINARGTGKMWSRILSKPSNLGSGLFRSRRATLSTLILGSYSTG